MSKQPEIPLEVPNIVATRSHNTARIQATESESPDVRQA